MPVQRRKTPSRGRWTTLLAALIGGLGLAATGLRAEFSTAVPVTATEGSATEVALSLDPANNVFLATVAGEHTQIDIIGPSLRVTQEIDGAEGARREPDMTSNSLGATFLVFSEENADGVHDVWMTTNRGGKFIAPANISLDATRDDRLPRVATDVAGDPRLAWESTAVLDPDDVQVYYQAGAASPRVIAAGARPSLYVGPRSRSHLVYVRDNTLWYRREIESGGEFTDEAVVVRFADSEGVEAHVTIDENETVLILYSNQGSLYFVSRPGEAGKPFSPPRLVDSGEVVDPELRVRRGGVVSLVYVKEGDVWVVQGVADFFLPPERISDEPTEPREEGPTLVIDNCANLHIAFVMDGEVFYTNNATEVVADFTATPPSGEGPLTVRFRDLSNGKVQKYLWDFGDGTGSNEPNPTHQYGLPGKYTVTLTVFNADRESVETKTDFITVQESSNTMQIPSQKVLPNQKDVWFPVLATHDEPIQSFQVHAEWDPGMLTLNECSQEFTVIRSMSPDLFECNIGEHSVEIGVLFELEPPFLHPELVPGTKQPIVNLRFDVSNGAPPGSTTEIKLINDAARSPILNIFTVEGLSVLPVIKSAKVEILDFFPLPTFFLRGDADGSGSVDITDAIRILNYLFLGGVAPACMDAADVQDAGRVDISAPISLLNFLFLGGPAPAVPFPVRGIDPTPDAFECPRT